MNKVAEITLLFWVMKIVATTLGETLGDFISMTLGLGYMAGLGITSVLLALTLALQLSRPRYTPSVYWLVIVGTTTLGTEISDFIDRTLQTGYALGSLLLVACLASVLYRWHAKYGNLEVSPIQDKRKEMHYWAAVLVSNSLGTAFGDFLSDDAGLPYLTGAAVTGGIILVVILLHYFSRLNHILLFWIAFIFTRPFGATFGDFLTKPPAKGGMGLGTLSSSMATVALMALLVLLSHAQRSKGQARS